MGLSFMGVVCLPWMRHWCFSYPFSMYFTWDLFWYFWCWLQVVSISVLFCLVFCLVLICIICWFLFLSNSSSSSPFYSFSWSSLDYYLDCFFSQSHFVGSDSIEFHSDSCLYLWFIVMVDKLMKTIFFEETCHSIGTSIISRCSIGYACLCGISFPYY